VRDARNDMWTPFPLVEPAWWCSQYQANPAVVAPGHTDLMVAPETIDAFMEANPLPPDNPPPLPMTPPATAFSATVADPEDDF
jgi:hypothetical protein